MNSHQIKDRVHRERMLRHVQTAAVLVAMAALFAVTGYVLLGAAGLALLVGMAFVLLLFVGRRELQVDTSRAQQLGPGHLPEVPRMLRELSRDAELPSVPQAYAIPADEMNAATMGKESQPVMAITAPMLDTLDSAQLRAILAHEVMHIAQHDLRFIRLVMMLQVLTISVSRMGWLLLVLFWPLALTSGVQIPVWAILLLLGAPVASALLQAALSRSREYAADLGAVELTGDPEALAEALERIDRRRNQFWRQVLPVPQRPRNRGSLLRTHPAQEERVRRLRALAHEA
jgi:heat shock protein HtpX